MEDSLMETSQESGQNLPVEPSMQEQLITMLQEMYDFQQAIVLTIGEADRMERGTMERWSLKDTLAHIVAWSDVLNMRLGMLASGLTPPDLGDDDQVNAEFYQLRYRLSWSAVLESSRKAYNGLIERIRAFEATDLSDPQRFEWCNGDPLWRKILGTAYIHPLTHLAYYYNQRGQIEQALKIQEEAAVKLLAYDQSPSWQSQVIYNLACQYALSGDAPGAVDRLRQAMRIESGLLEWSKKDPDFDGIRSEPAFQAIYDEFGNP